MWILLCEAGRSFIEELLKLGRKNEGPLRTCRCERLGVSRRSLQGRARAELEGGIWGSTVLRGDKLPQERECEWEKLRPRS